ncbi:MAG: hypothetical protein AB9866_24515 [Syntrophobacteraceae bacterium]
MATKTIDANIVSVMPLQRDVQAIQAVLASPNDSGSAVEVSQQTLATIELTILEGTTFFKRRAYNPALEKYKAARALIYKILYNDFDASDYAGSPEWVLLPASRILEETVISASSRLSDFLRPAEIRLQPVFGIPVPPMPDPLMKYTKTGFREMLGINDRLQDAAATGAGLLSEHKTQSAIAVLDQAFQEVKKSGRPVDSSLAGAVALNLATAYLQAKACDKAITMGQEALDYFTTAKDPVGQSQALHAMGAGAMKAGQARQAKSWLTQASGILKKAAGQSDVTAREMKALPNVQEMDTAAEFPAQGVSVLKTLQFTTRDTLTLQPILKMDTGRFTVRVPGRGDCWGCVQLMDRTEAYQFQKTWHIGVPVGEKVMTLAVGDHATVSTAEIKKDIYEARIKAVSARDLTWRIANTSTTAFYLTHLYAYVLPVAIGDCLHELGQYDKAEASYLQASSYTYLNTTIEATALWIRFANNALEWGNAVYKNEDLPGAGAQYAKLITMDGKVPNSFLYSTAALNKPANDARNLITHLLDRPLPAVNWEIAIPVLSAMGFLTQIADGLDFYGLALSPIHTFEYLQNIAKGFSREAIMAEQEFVNFQSRAEQEAETKRDLQTVKAMAEAEANAKHEQWLSALDDEAAARHARDLAIKRRNDAQDQRDQYSASSWDQIWGQAASMALSGGEDAYWSEITGLADQLDRGETISGPGPKLAAAECYSAGRKTREYELEKMQDNINELTNAIAIAEDQLNAATHRAAAAELAYQASFKRFEMAGEALNAFNTEFFTPDSWGKMANVMRGIARNYLWQAIRIAKLMERAYNFENDTNIKIIKNDYGYALGNPAAGMETTLLGGEGLSQDIEAFTYHAITTKTRKISRIKDVISLSGDFPAAFEEFRNTGLLSFETDLYEFDRLHPGFYGQRLEAIELEVVGILPEGGLNGTLSAGGVSAFRRKNGTPGKRVHQIDTMALSEFTLRNDMFLYTAETGVRGLFQGLGVGNTFQVHLPKRSNNLDFRRIMDIRLVVYYTAKFDAVLRTSVLAKPPRPGEMAMLRNFGLRYDFPDAWYTFYKTGTTMFNLERSRLPFNQDGFEVKSALFRVVTKAGVSNQNLTLAVTSPAGTTGTVTTNANGVVSTSSPSLAAIEGQDPIGAWTVQLKGGASVTEAGQVKYDRVYNIQFGLEYGFTSMPEVL